MTLLSLGLCASMLLGTNQMVNPKQIGAPASDLLNNRLRSPDPATVGRPFGHAMLDIAFDDEGQWQYDLPIPPTAHLSLLPVGPGCEAWSLIATNPSGQTDGVHRTITEGSLQPFFPVTAQRVDIANPMVGTWRITIHNGHPGEIGHLIVRDRSGIALQIHPTSPVALVGHPIVLRIALAAVDRSGSPLQDALDGLASGLDIINAQINWRDSRSNDATFELVQNGPWLEHTFTPTVTGPHEARIEIVGIDADGFTFLRSANWHCQVNTPVVVTGLQQIDLDENRLAIDLDIDCSEPRSKVLVGSEVWCNGSDGMRPRCWIGGMTAVTDGRIRLVLDKRWLTLEGGNGLDLQLRETRIADPNAAQPLLPEGAVGVLSLGNVEVPVAAPHDPDVLLDMQHGKGDQPGFQVEGGARDQGSRADQYGGHNLMLSHGYCSDGQSFPPSDFTGDVAVYYNPDQNFSHDEFALDIWSLGSQYKSYGLVGHSQGGNAAVHLFTFYWSGLDWASDGRLLQGMGVPFSGTALAGNLAVLAELFGIGCGINYDMTYDGAAVWLSYIPTSTRERTWTWTSTFQDEWWSYDYCHIVTDLLLWDPDDGVVENSEGDLDGAHNMGTTTGWCHIEDMSDPPEVTDTNRTSSMNSEGAR